MTTYEWGMSGNSSRYKNRLVVSESAPNYATNQRTVSWSLYLVSYNNTYPAWTLSSTSRRSVTIAGQNWSGSFAFDFRPSSSTKVIFLASGSKVITHNSSGYATISIASSIAADNNAVGSGGGSTSLSLSRISQVPLAPSGLATGSTTTSSVALSWTAPNNMGSSITGYEVQRATNSGFSSGVVSTAFSGTAGTLTGLTAGATYWFRVRAKNARGWGSYSSSTSKTLPMPIPDPPSQVSTPSVGTTTPSSIALLWSAPNNGGATITGYEVQYATNTSFSSGVGTRTFSGTSGTVSGLTPGPTYYLRVRAQNYRGWGPYSNYVWATPALPAPSFNSWAQNSTTGLVASWSAPSTTTGLTGYRLQVARNSGFTESVQNIDLGNVLTSTVTGLAGGRVYYARVAARTSGGVNVYSSSRNVMLILDAGNLDGWSRVGTKPANINYYTAEGLRRGTSGTNQVLWLESLSTASVTLAANTFGIQKTITGLVVAKAYRFQVSGTLDGAPLAKVYKLNIISESAGTPATVTSNTGLPFIEFVADASSVTFQILLAESVSVVGAQDSVERIAFHGIKVLELSTDYPQRLRETVYESNLANHFDIACNSVGASWYVGKDGVTRFRLPGAALPVAAIFSDDTTPGARSYVDIVAGYDTRSTVNRIEATNYGLDAGRVNEENETLIVENAVSQTNYGTHSTYFDMNLWTVAPYDVSFGARLTALLVSHSEPELLISQIIWNAQEDLPLANALEVGDRLTVIYRGTVQDSQIVAINHNITPTRWMVTFDLQSL